MASLGYCATMLNHVAISLDRMHAITQPLTYATSTDKVVARRILVVWLAAALFACHQLTDSRPEWPAEYRKDYICPTTKVRKGTYPTGQECVVPVANIAAF